MSEVKAYWDKRSEFFKRFFDLGLSYDEYLAQGTDKHAQRWSRFHREISLDDRQKQLLSGFIRQMNVLVLSGIWCGDCARQGPMLRVIETHCPVMAMRLIDNRTHPELQDELRINGAEKVPVVVVLNEEFFEVSRFGDQHLSVYRSKAAREWGPACDPGIVPSNNTELMIELDEWVRYFERIQLLLRLAPALRKRYND